MSAAVAFTRATISALSASVRVTGPLADLMYSVLPSTLSIVPATRWVCCCAHAVETANAAAKAAAAIIRIVLISDLPKGDIRGEHPPVSPDGEAGRGGGERMRSTRLLGIAASAVVAIGMSSGAQANLVSAFYRPARKTKLTGRGCPLPLIFSAFCMADRRYREQQTSIDHHRSADWHLWPGVADHA